MKPGEQLWTDQAAGLSLGLSREPSPQVIGLLTRTVWGSNDLRYRILDVEAKLARLTGPHVFTLEKDGALASVCILNRRTTRLIGAPFDSFHFVMIATDTAFAAQRYASLLTEHAVTFSREQMRVPGAAYAYIESTTEYSIRMSDRAGHSFEAAIPLTVFSRLRPSDNGAVGPLESSETKGAVDRLSALYEGHDFDDFGDSIIPGEYHVLREGGEIVAGVQAEALNWSVVSLPGLSGWLIVNLFPRLPLLGRVLTPADLRLLRFGNILAEPGREGRLLTLLETVLARQGARLGLIMMDARSPVYRRIRAHGRLGLLDRAVEGTAKVVGDFKGVSEPDIARIRERPMLMSPLDVF